MIDPRALVEVAGILVEKRGQNRTAQVSAYEITFGAVPVSGEPVVKFWTGEIDDSIAAIAKMLSPPKALCWLRGPAVYPHEARRICSKRIAAEINPQSRALIVGEGWNFTEIIPSNLVTE